MGWGFHELPVGPARAEQWGPGSSEPGAGGAPPPAPGMRVTARPTVTAPPKKSMTSALYTSDCCLLHATVQPPPSTCSGPSRSATGARGGRYRIVIPMCREPGWLDGLNHSTCVTRSYNTAMLMAGLHCNDRCSRGAESLSAGQGACFSFGAFYLQHGEMQ